MLWLQKLIHPTVIAVRNGRCVVAKGRVPASTRRDLDAVFEDFGVTRGTLAVDGTSRCHFSASIPAESHQRLRNLLASA